MKALRAILVIIGGAFAIFLIAAVVWVLWPDKPSVVMIENHGLEQIELTVVTTNPSSYSWRGKVRPGERVSKSASFSDNSFQVTCRDSRGVIQKQTGYVTNGMTFLVTLKIRGCQDIAYEAETLP